MWLAIHGHLIKRLKAHIVGVSVILMMSEGKASELECRCNNLGIRKHRITICGVGCIRYFRCFRCFRCKAAFQVSVCLGLETSKYAKTKLVRHSFVINSPDLPTNND